LRATQDSPHRAVVGAEHPSAQQADQPADHDERASGDGQSQPGHGVDLGRSVIL
jgi:hypothetical protein